MNSVGDFIVGFTQFASNQHPATGYAVHFAADAAGTIQDAFTYHSGEDYYHKTFGATTDRHRWGDYSKAQVDPSDDRSLWVLDEYAQARTGIDDGNTGSNSSRWGTWWAKVAGSAPPLAVATSGSAPLAFGLSRVGPVPTAGPLRIEYAVAREAPVRLSVVDLQGRTVSLVVEGMQRAGRYEALWNHGANLPAGVYFVNYRAAGQNFTRRVVVTH